ncbi:MAG: thioredoxin [Alphaproteobacteria bacterium]|nr:MAG: thioredoxin [Alphaproteobacteria bacterium]
MTAIKNCNENDFENEVLKSNLPVIVDFWAEWCGPCKMLTPILEELSNEMKNEINVVKVNLDENQDLAMKYSIRSIPTLLLFKEGNLIDTKVGLCQKAK